MLFIFFLIKYAIYNYFKQYSKTELIKIKK